MELVYNKEIEQMMFVAGEVHPPSIEVLTLVETIIKDQAHLMLETANSLAARRGSKLFTVHDVIFQIRHDPARVARLRTHLRWKGIRKKAKDADDDRRAAETAQDVFNEAAPERAAAAANKSRPAVSAMPWDPEFFFSVQPPGSDLDLDEDLHLSNDELLAKLHHDDEYTKLMTVKDYVQWSESRQASFTYRKKQRFRKWAGIGVLADTKATDDSYDVLSFLLCEMVQRLTKAALAAQRAQIRLRQPTEREAKLAATTTSGGLFELIGLGRQAIEAEHVRQGFLTLQNNARRRRVKLGRVSEGAVLKLI